MLGFLMVGISLHICGCASLPARQTPKIVEAGNKIVGGGATYIGSPDKGNKHLGVFDLYTRLPLQDKFDVGFRLSGYLPTYWYMLGMDMRYQVRSEWPMIAAGVGVGIDMESGVSAETTFVMGSESIYGGIRLHYLTLGTYFGEHYSESEDEYGDSKVVNSSYRLYRTGFVPGLFMGASIGNLLKVMPEVGAVLGANGKPYLYGAISVEWRDVDNKPRVIALPRQVELPKSDPARVELPKPAPVEPVVAPK